MEQAFPATDRTWQAAMWRRFRRGEIATLERTFFRNPQVEGDNCACPECVDAWQSCFPFKKTWAEKVNVLVTSVPVFDAKFVGCDVTHWRVPFGWIPAQQGDTVEFP